MLNIERVAYIHALIDPVKLTPIADTIGGGAIGRAEVVPRA